jgi:hypothetical protein
MPLVPNDKLTSSNLVPLDVAQDAIRRYIDRIAPLQTDEDLNYKMRLFLVPVNSDGCDVLPIGTGGLKYVYDFNLPCPATCDVTSPLYYGNL